MATLARYQSFAQDSAGNTLASASIQVNNESGGALAAIYSDRAGATPLANPFTGDSDGFFAFHVAAGAYKITVTKDAATRTLRYVAIGTMAEFDNAATNGLPALFMEAGSVITFGNGVATIYDGTNELFVDGAANGWNFRVGAKTGTAGIFKQITICGSDNGSGAGAFIQSDLGSAGSIAWALGNRSAILGGTFDRTTVLLSRDALDFGIGEPGVSFNTYMQLTTTVLQPYVNDGMTLGSTTKGWADLRLASDGTINIGNGQFTITPSNSAGTLVFAGSGLFDRILTASGFHILTANGMTSGGITGVGYRLSSVSNFGIFFGSGAPTLSAGKGSLYLRSDGTTTNNRAYINTDGSTTWTAVTTAA